MLSPKLLAKCKLHSIAVLRLSIGLDVNVGLLRMGRGRHRGLSRFGPVGPRLLAAEGLNPFLGPNALVRSGWPPKVNPCGQRLVSAFFHHYLLAGHQLLSTIYDLTASSTTRSFGPYGVRGATSAAAADCERGHHEQIETAAARRIHASGQHPHGSLALPWRVA